MRKHINNKLYDTYGARCIFFRKTSNLDRTNICYEEVGVYRKKTGEFFLYSFRGQKGDIVPLTYQEAQQYIQLNGTAEEYMNAFNVGKQSETVNIKAEIPRDAKVRLDMLCSKYNVTQSEFLINCINQYYEKG